MYFKYYPLELKLFSVSNFLKLMVSIMYILKIEKWLSLQYFSYIRNWILKNLGSNYVILLYKKMNTKILIPDLSRSAYCTSSFFEFSNFLDSTFSASYFELFSVISCHNLLSHRAPKVNYRISCVKKKHFPFIHFNSLSFISFNILWFFYYINGS